MVGMRGVRLEHLRIGRDIFTTREALERFYANLAAAYLATPSGVFEAEFRHRAGIGLDTGSEPVDPLDREGENRDDR